MVCALLILQVTVKLHFTEVTPIYYHQMCMRVSSPHTHRELLSVMACTAQYMKNNVIVLLISISTVMTKVEHVLYALKRNQSTEHFLKHLKVIFPLPCMSCLYPLSMILFGYWSFSYWFVGTPYTLKKSLPLSVAKNLIHLNLTLFKVFACHVHFLEVYTVKYQYFCLFVFIFYLIISKAILTPR